MADMIPMSTMTIGGQTFEIKDAQSRKNINEHAISEEAHHDIRLLIEGLTNRLNALANSDDITLDQMAEVVACIKTNKSLIDSITTSKVNTSDIVDNLTTSVSNKPLSAKQGAALKALIDAITVPNKLSQLANDVGYAKEATTLAGYGITDAPTLEQFNELANRKGADGLITQTDDSGNNILYLTLDGEIFGDGIALPKGGSGGGGSSNNAILTVTNKSGWIAKTISDGADCSISFTWSSLEGGMATGNGVLTLSVGGAIKITQEISQGEHTFNVSKYLTTGSNKVKVEISDTYGNTRLINYTVNSVAVSISSYFDGSVAYTGDIPFNYTPVGAVNKTVHFVMDGTEIDTKDVVVSGREMPYTIPAQSHGSHVFEVYFTATIDGQPVESNRLYYDLICYEDGNTTPIISVPTGLESVKQYSTVSIPYLVYTPNLLTSTVALKDGTTTLSTPTVDRTLQTWSYKALESGTTNLSIVCGDTVKRISFNVAINEIEVSAETENLELYLSTAGRNNNEENPLEWKSGSVAAELTGFNLTSDGWQLDDDKNVVLRVAGNARVNIPFNIFGTDFRTTGKTIEIEFATRDVRNYDSVILSTWSGDRGIKITAQKAMLKSEQSEIFTQYKENETVRVSFTIEKRAENRLLSIYINGTMSGVVQYPADDDFAQSEPVGISIGSNECTTDIYCIRVYSNNLSRYQILDNWIADTQNVETLLERYNRNNIFDDYGNITTSKIPSYLPYMVLNANKYTDLPQSKGDKKTISGTYIDPVHPERGFVFAGAEIDVQGTSSQYYSRKNYKIKFKGGFTVGETTRNTYQLRNTSIPTNEFTFKADVASSEGANNVELAMLYDDTCPVKTPPQLVDDRVRQGIEGYPMLMFYGIGDDLTFLGKYNFNNDKGTGEVFGFNSGDESWEILQNNTEMVIWKDDNFTGDGWKTSFEARYPDKNQNTTRLAAFASWLKSTDTTVVDSDEEKAARLQKFKDEFADWCNVDAMLFNYIFTETFLMVDNRAKNAFPTRYDEDGKWLILPYDYDTAIGINNEGELKFGYELEDTDLVNGNNVYNGQDSVLYVNMRLAFADEIMDMYKTLRTGDIFSYEEIERRFEEHQAVWGEAVFNEDARFKYIDPLVNEGNKTYLPMLQGSKAEQRKWWLYNRFRYLDSKYDAGDTLEDYIMLRSYSVADIEVTPYADIYASAKFDSAWVKKRALRVDGTVTLENPLSGGRDAVISIYSASQLSSINDLSGMKPGMADFSKAIRLTNLKVGDGAAGYDNPNLTDLTIGNLTLLKNLDVRNCSALAQAVDVSGCTNIENVYFDGTAITGLTLPNGGNLKVLHLPDTITNFTILNQKNLTDLTVAGFQNVSTFRVENTPAVDVFTTLYEIQPNSRVRLIGLDKTFNSASGILSFMDKLDTFRGLDENGNNLDKAVVSGVFHVNSVTSDELVEMNTRYPNITIDYKSFTVYVRFYNGDELLSEQTGVSGDAITVPADPTKESTEQYHYPFKGWSLDGVNVVEVGVIGNEPVNYYAVFDNELRYYTIRFFNDSEWLQTVSVPYGANAIYTGNEPTKEGEYAFNGWNPTPVNITADMDCYAQFKSTQTDFSTTDFTLGYGVEWDYSQNSSALTRIGLSDGLSDPAPATDFGAVGSSPFDSVMPWCGMKRYNIINGAVAYSEDDAGFSMTDYDTVVYIPPFYYAAYKDETNSKWRWSISPTAKEGYNLHPGSGRYIGRYHTSGSSAGVFSKSGGQALVSVSKEKFRAYTSGKGEKWWMLDIATWSALQLLYLVEFADFNSQNKLGTGAGTSGQALGSSDGAIYHTYNGGATTNQYRWIEQPFGRVMNWVDGMFIPNSVIYIGTKNSTFADSTVGLQEAGVTIPAADWAGVYITGFGYSKTFPWVFLPDAKSGGSSSTFVTDAFRMGDHVRYVAFVGGNYYGSPDDGFFALRIQTYASNKMNTLGSRLIYVP